MKQQIKGKIEEMWVYDTKSKKGFVWPCGCTQTAPHSHLIVGHACPCENGVPTYPEITNDKKRT